MRKGWVSVPLGDVAILDIDKVSVTPGHKYEVAGLLNAGKGMLNRGFIDGAETNYPTLHQLHANQLVMRKLTAWEGPITVVPAEYDGHFASSEFPTFTLDQERLEPRYMRLLCQQPSFWERMKESSTGSVQRRKRVSPPQLLAIDVLLPPLAEQRRIVDLIGAVDDALAAAEEEACRADKAREAAEVAHFADGGETALTDVTEFAGGYAFSDRFQGGTGPIPVYKCSDMNAPGNETEMFRAANSVTEETLREMKARAWPSGTVIFPKVGAALLTEKRRMLRSRAAFDNNVMGLIPNPSIRPEYLLSYMRTVRLGDYAQPGAVPSVNQKHFQQMTLDLPSLEEQDEFLGVVVALIQIEAGAADVASCLRAARGALLADLVSGDAEIPQSYDSLLEMAS